MRAVVSALDVLRAAIAGRRCVVLGSAPLERELELAGDEVVVSVNGAISSVPAGRLVDVWVLNARSDVHTWAAERRRLSSAMLAQGANRDVEVLALLTRDDQSEEVTLKALRLHRARLRQVVTISRAERTILEKRSGARIDRAYSREPVSLGLFAVGMSLELGAAHVRMVGFSWDPGYAYLPGDGAVTTRGHVYPDQMGLARMVAQYGRRLEHALEIPDSITKEVALMALKQTRAAGSASSSSTTSPTSTAPVKARKVRATEMTFYGGGRRREGEVFVLRSPSHFRASCMADVPDDTPIGPAPPDTLRPARVGIPSLQHNAADPVDEVVDGKGDGDAVL